MAGGGKFGGKDVKKGGRMSVKTAGAAAKGRPSAKMGGGARGEFAVQTGGAAAGGSPGSQFSNRKGGEYAQASAGE